MDIITYSNVLIRYNVPIYYLFAEKVNKNIR